MSEDAQVFFDTALPDSQVSLRLIDHDHYQKEAKSVHQKPSPVVKERSHVRTSRALSLVSIKRWKSSGRVPEILARTSLTLSLNVLATALFIITAWFSQATFASSTIDPLQDKIDSAFNLDTSATLTILRIFQGILSTCSLFVVLQVFELVAWALVTEKSGISTLGFLGLSPTTSMLGNFGIAFSKHSKWTDRMGVLLKMSLTTLVWIAGILLFANTNIKTVYRPVFSYNVTAGVGPFHGEFVPEFIDFLVKKNSPYNYSVVPYGVIRTSSNLITNTMNSVGTKPVIPCKQNETCDSYLLTGGLLLADPWGSQDFPNEPVITISNAPVTQIDFKRNIPHNVTFDDRTDCAVFGQQNYGIGIKFCLARQAPGSSSLNAKIFVCQGNVAFGECLTEDNASISTALTTYTRHATFTTARGNLTVIDAQTLDEARPQSELDIENLKLSFSWLFNFSAANIPGASASAAFFWNAQKQLNNAMWNTEAVQLFESLLAFPFWHFQENNYGNIRIQAQNITQGLASDFYTTATIGTPYLQIVVDKSMFTAFCFLHMVVIIFTWTALIWLWITKKGLPEISNYPLVDFVTKTNIASQSQYISRSSFPKGFEPSTSSSEIRKLLRKDVTTLRDQRTESPTGLTPVEKRARTA